VDLIIEGNFTEYVSNGPLGALYVTELWRFKRKQGVLSRTPEGMASLSCPSCGNSGELRPDGSCPFCGNVVNTGTFQWVVYDIKFLTKTPRPPIQLSGGVETGTQDQTVYQPDLEVARRQFYARDASFSWAEFEARARHTFLALQAAWSDGKWIKARPYETDHLFNMHRYWIEMYQRDGLQNRLDDVQVGRVEAVKFDQDAFYDIVTVRIWASMKDYMVKNGQTVSGDANRAREFSEYWTFMRRTGAVRKSPATDPSTCPNCGAPLQVSVAGECEYCSSKITTGNFDWVLSLIEQDEAYRG
jgi:hypothetical protein